MDSLIEAHRITDRKGSILPRAGMQQGLSRSKTRKHC